MAPKSAATRPSENLPLKLAAFAVIVTCNALANILPINGRGTGQISDMYANLFAAIGYRIALHLFRRPAGS